MKRFNSVPLPADLQRLFEVSPIKHVHRVVAPMAFMLGSRDRRVPPADAQQYLSALRATGRVEVRCINFPDDSHALDRPQTEFEQWQNVVYWLQKHGVK